MLLLFNADCVGIGLEQIKISGQAGQFAARHFAGSPLIGAEEKPCFIGKIAKVKCPRSVGAVQRDRQLCIPLDGSRALGAGLPAQIRCSGTEPLEIIFQTALIGFPAFRSTAVYIQQIVRVHKVGADVMHIQLAHRGQPHIGISHHTAGYDAGLLHDTVAGHTEFPHIGQGCAILKVSAGNGADLGHFAAQHLPPCSGKDVEGGT